MTNGGLREGAVTTVQQFRGMKVLNFVLSIVEINVLD